MKMNRELINSSDVVLSFGSSALELIYFFIFLMLVCSCFMQQC